MGGEDRANIEVLDGLLQVFGVGVLEAVRRSGEESALGGPLGAQFAAAVHLLGHIRQMEVRREGADQFGRGLQLGAAQQLGGGLTVLAGQAADLLDQFQELRALLPDEGLPSRSPRRRISARSSLLVVVVWSSALLTGAAPCSVEARLKSVEARLKLVRREPGGGRAAGAA